MVIPEHLELAVKKVQDTNLICPPVVSQVAASAALDTKRESLKTNIEQLKQVRMDILK